MSKIKDPKRTFKRRFKKLTEFETWNEVYDFLVARGIKGERIIDSMCPIANYLAKGFDDEHLGIVSVYEDVITFDNNRLQKPVEFNTPTAVADFIRRFDNGNYPDLEIEYEGI